MIGREIPDSDRSMPRSAWCDVGATDLDGKIVAAMERISQAIRVRQGVVARDEGLTPLQLNLVLYLASCPRRGSTVGQASARLDLAPPTVSGAVSTLASKGFVKRRQSSRDRRVGHLLLTDSGRALAGRLEEWQGVFESAATQFSRTTREAVFLFLVKLLETLHEDGLLSVARMCQTCQHLEEFGVSPDEAPYRCRLTGQEKGPAGLRLDCPTHLHV